MTVGVPAESMPGERRVALVPGDLARLAKAGLDVVVETGAGVESGHRDGEYAERGAAVDSRVRVFERADLVLQVRGYGTNPGAGGADLALMRRGQALIGFWDPLGAPEVVREAAATGATVFSMELMPRITRAQSMDALSSMATVAGYKAVLLAADRLPRMFPLLMTAAGTLSPAKVLVIGVGVAGLQAIATAKRLGAVVEAYDVRPAVKDQVRSLGARFLELPLETEGAEDKGGYASARDESFYRRQRELMTHAVAENDVVITTAAVPGQRAPVLVTAEMVAGMRPGSVIVDVAAERGGNCELTRPGETVAAGGTTILGPANLPSLVPFHASQMYSRNVVTFLLHLVKEGRVSLDREDEIVAGTLLARDGDVVHPRLLELLGGAPAGR